MFRSGAIKFAAVAILLAVSLSTAQAQQPAASPGGAYQGYSGGASAAAPAPVQQTAPQMPAAAPQPQIAVAPAPAAATPAQPADPCAAFMSDYNSYAVCQDRMQKIQRLKDAQKQRDSDVKAYYDNLNKEAQPPAVTTPGQPGQPGQAQQGQAAAGATNTTPSTPPNQAPATTSTQPAATH